MKKKKKFFFKCSFVAFHPELPTQSPLSICYKAYTSKPWHWPGPLFLADWSSRRASLGLKTLSWVLAANPPSEQDEQVFVGPAVLHAAPRAGE